MPVHSAGLLLHRRIGQGTAAAEREVFIAHMGGPFWARRTAGAWSIPKGEYEPASEDPLAAAHREFAEELGVSAPDVAYLDLGEFRYASGKRLRVYAGDGSAFTPGRLVFGTFELEWPPRSGRVRRFPEVDDARWVAAAQAERLLVAGQRPALAALLARLS